MRLHPAPRVALRSRPRAGARRARGSAPRDAFLRSRAPSALPIDEMRPHDAFRRPGRRPAPRSTKCVPIPNTLPHQPPFAGSLRKLRTESLRTRAPLRQLRDDRLVDARAVRRPRRRARSPSRAPRRAPPASALATSQNVPTTAAAPRSSIESPTAMTSSATNPRACMWRATARAFEAARGTRWYARPPPRPRASPRCRPAASPEPFLDEQFVGLRHVDVRPQVEPRGLAPAVPRVVHLERRSARAAARSPRRVVGSPRAEQSRASPSIDHPAPRLEDVRAHAEHARVVEQRRLPPPRVRDDLDVGPRARLERPRAEQRERAVAVVEQRRAAPSRVPSRST